MYLQESIVVYMQLRQVGAHGLLNLALWHRRLHIDDVEALRVGVVLAQPRQVTAPAPAGPHRARLSPQLQVSETRRVKFAGILGRLENDRGLTGDCSPQNLQMLTM